MKTVGKERARKIGRLGEPTTGARSQAVMRTLKKERPLDSTVHNAALMHQVRHAPSTSLLSPSGFALFNTRDNSVSGTF